MICKLFTSSMSRLSGYFKVSDLQQLTEERPESVMVLRGSRNPGFGPPVFSVVPAF